MEEDLKKREKVKSLPSWERGLKRKCFISSYFCDSVAPFVGAWIETMKTIKEIREYSSLPSWERGLKHLLSMNGLTVLIVAPFVGAWIETQMFR